MNKNGNYNAIENMLIDMRRHVSSLQEKLSVAGVAVSKSQTVNEKILTMKEVLLYFLILHINKGEKLQIMQFYIIVDYGEYLYF